VKSWMPTPLRLGEGRAGREETDKHLSRSAGVVSVACQKGGLGNWGKPAVGGDRNFNVVEGATAKAGVGEGQMYRGSRVMPVEGRTLTSGVLVKKQGEVIGDEPGNTIQDPDASEKAVSKSERQSRITASICSTTRSIARMFSLMPTIWRRPIKARRVWMSRHSSRSSQEG
jgi:hypothetical protein